MDADAPEPTARQWLSRSPTGDERDAELTRLRERLAFYQSFEGLIQDNIARSGDLLRQAMTMRESAAVEIATAQAEAARQRVDDRSRYRILFSAMLDELTALQGQAERLARRLTVALDEIEADLPPGAAPPSFTEFDFGDDDTLRQALALDAGALALFDHPDASSELELPEAFDKFASEMPFRDPLLPGTGPLDAANLPEIEDDAVGTKPEPDPWDTSPARVSALDAQQPEPSPEVAEDVRSDESVDIPLDILPFAPEDVAPAKKFAFDNDLAQQPVYDPDRLAETPAISATTANNATIVLVHGVPRATTALSLKRYLEGLAHVGVVEPREFAEGILRLEVSGARPLAFEDLRSWSEGQGLEPVHLRDDLVEVRLSR
ncbi:MAG: hypothetical protein QOJ59_728 [Thermomicrobiales bacterium]|jgi:hypothetical protein|nr:hypothetical protein [Thermomicrobiales bacterium]